MEEKKSGRRIILIKARKRFWPRVVRFKPKKKRRDRRRVFERAFKEIFR